MPDDLLSSSEAARRLGIAPTTFYDWLGKSRCQQLVIRGQSVSIRYYQGGAKGQGRMRIHATEVERILGLLEVRPQPHFERRPRTRPEEFPGITVPLGRPDRS
jgi:hypothetical protein